MTNYNDLTQEQKESITKELRDLFEELKQLLDNCANCITEKTQLKGEYILGEIKGFQEGEKLAIKIIDEHMKDFKGCEEYVWDNSIKDERECGERIGFPDLYLFCDKCKWKQERIEELKKQREQLQFEVELK